MENVWKGVMTCCPFSPLSFLLTVLLRESQLYISLPNHATTHVLLPVVSSSVTGTYPDKVVKSPEEEEIYYELEPLMGCKRCSLTYQNSTWKIQPKKEGNQSQKYR